MSDNLMNRARGPIKLGDYYPTTYGRPAAAEMETHLSRPLSEFLDNLDGFLFRMRRARDLLTRRGLLRQPMEVVRHRRLPDDPIAQSAGRRWTTFFNTDFSTGGLHATIMARRCSAGKNRGIRR